MCSSSCKYDPKEGKLVLVDPITSLIGAIAQEHPSSSFVRSIHDDEGEDDEDVVRSTVTLSVITAN